jgi:DNA-binding FadR family transcriptional regulator
MFEMIARHGNRRRRRSAGRQALSGYVLIDSRRHGVARRLPSSRDMPGQFHVNRGVAREAPTKQQALQGRRMLEFQITGTG